MKTLRRKLVRDVHRQFGQFVAIVVLILLGTALLVASYDAYRNLDRSYRSLFDVAVDHRAAVNRVEVLSGERFSSASEGVLVEQQLANHFGVTRGDELAIRGPLGWRDVEVTGVAASRVSVAGAKPAGGLHNPRQLRRAVRAAAAGGAADGWTERGARSRDGPRSRGRRRPGRRAATQAGAATVTTRAEQPSNAVLQDDIEVSRG
ncbi:MAG TPA: hypothetical protein VK923_05190 [Euzebyales bacterium]|nr:hypothetical protein [Euzebyales bacterium]